MIKLLGALLLVISLVSCEKELNVELPFEGSRLVVYCLMNPDSVWSVKVSKTIPATGENALPGGIENARIVIFEDGIAIDTLKHSENGSYSSSSKKRPQLNRSYHLTAQAPNFPNVETLPERFPEQVTVIGFQFSEEASSPFGSGEQARKFVLTLQDDRQHVNQYSVQVLGYYKEYVNKLNVFGINRPDDVEDLCGFRTAENTFVLKSTCFNKGIFILQLGVELTGFVQAPLQEPGKLGNKRPSDRIVCHVRAISDSYYRYLKSYYQPAGFETIFNQPQNVFSNVKGGYGLLAAYQEKIIVIL